MAARSRLVVAVEIGSRVTVAGKKGEVKFLGTTEFAGGEWIGVELDGAEGKNDGSVNGVRYFECRDGHGLFVKKAQIRLDRSSAVTPVSTETAGTLGPGAVAGMTSSAPAAAGLGGGVRGSRLAAIRERNRALKESLAAGRASAASVAPSGVAGLRSPGGSVGGSSEVHSPSGSVASLPTPASTDSGGSVGGDASSGAGAHFGITRYGRGYSCRAGPYFHPTTHSRGQPMSRRCEALTPNPNPNPRPRCLSLPIAGGVGPRARLAFPPPGRSHQAQPGGEETDEEEGGLRVRVEAADDAARRAEEKVGEVSERLLSSEALCRDLESQVSLLQKKSENILQEERLKVSALAKERAAAAAAGRREAELEGQIAELSDACEALTLDKEQLAMEKEDTQERVDELQVELETMKLDMEHLQLSAAENEAAARVIRDAGISGGGEAGGVDFGVLVEQNHQLKEALKTLHTHSTNDKVELTKVKRAAEKEAAVSAALGAEVEKLKAWKEAKSKEMEDLMEQVDQGNAFQDMVETLTGKNLELGERVGELEAAVEDLESSLSEELELQQAEEIKALQAEVNRREMDVHKLRFTVDTMIRELEDSKQTIDRFR
ncbi:unnamed protein product [Discosporangium mesarthrocarpum]